MGHIKLSKGSSAEFDIISADNVIAVKLDTNDVKVFYEGGTDATIASTNGTLDQDDVQLVVNAIDVMEGASGPAPLTTLSETDLTVTAA